MVTSHWNRQCHRVVGLSRASWLKELTSLLSKSMGCWRQQRDKESTQQSSEPGKQPPWSAYSTQPKYPSSEYFLLLFSVQEKHLSLCVCSKNECVATPGRCPSVRSRLYARRPSRPPHPCLQNACAARARPVPHQRILEAPSSNQLSCKACALTSFATTGQSTGPTFRCFTF